MADDRDTLESRWKDIETRLNQIDAASGLPSRLLARLANSPTVEAQSELVYGAVIPV
jgi:hypothetical protein